MTNPTNPPPGYPAQPPGPGQPVQGYPPPGYPAQAPGPGQPAQGYPPPGYPAQAPGPGQPVQGYPPPGYPAQAPGPGQPVQGNPPPGYPVQAPGPGQPAQSGQPESSQGQGDMLETTGAAAPPSQDSSAAPGAGQGDATASTEAPASELDQSPPALDGIPQPPVQARPPQPPEEFAEKVACPNCGDTQTHWVVEKGAMRCDTCRATFQLDSTGVGQIVNDNVAGLSGTELSSGAGQDVDTAEPDNQVYTFRCPSCGSDLVVQAVENLPTVKCHWCRNTLTWSDRINNGARPDGIVPFALTREQAKAKMEGFLKRRRAFANRKFLRDYSLENIQPVYFPYFMVDVNAKSFHAGQGAHLVRKYSHGSGNDKTTYYDYDVYAFQRRFDLYVNDLLVPSNAAFAHQDAKLNTNNIINSVAPWQTSAAVPYSPQYLQGEYRAERRTSNVGQLHGQVMNQVMDISHVQANRTMPRYNHGIAYQQDDLQVQGERWVTLLCPVWLYSYLEIKKGKPMLHYIAVNGTTGETMGSVPTNKALMLAVAGVAEVVGIVGAVIWLVLGG